MASDNSFGESRTVIEKFDGKKNFSLWQVRMKDALVQQGVDEALNDKDEKPTGMTDKAWEKMNSKAVSTIRLSLTDDVVYDMIEETSAKDMWKKLEDLYMGKNFTNRLMLKQELYSLKRKEGVDLQCHIGEFNKLLCDLSNVGVKFDDEDKAVILLTSVKSTHKHLFSTMLYGRDTITVEQVKKALFSSEKMEKEDEKYNGESHALVAQVKKKTYWNRNYSGGGGKPKDGDVQDNRPYMERTCFYCGEKGHFIRTCPVRIKNERGVAAIVSEEEMFTDDVLSIFDKEKEATEWVLDSGCFSHLCPHREWFSSYEPMKGKAVMGNDSLSEVVGIGTIKIKTTNGLTRILTGVRHVPSLRRNVISLGVLDSKGFSFAANDGLMKVRKGPRIMLMGRKVGNLYFLLGNTIVEGEVTKLANMEQKSVMKTTEKVDNTVLAISTIPTVSTQGGDVGLSSETDEGLKFIDDVNLSIGDAE